MGNDRLAAHAGLAQRGYQYVKAYGMGKLYRKAREHFGRNALERGYQEWMILNRPSESEKELQREHHFVQEPLISIVVPIYRTPEVFLREMIESVLNQTYGKLELCLADGSGEDDTAGTVICEYVEKDPRVRYQKLGSNLGIAGNTNAAVNMAEGEYVALLDHDDLLEEHALFEIVKWLQNHPETDMVYTDEDKVTFDSKTYFKPHFKPDFNRELLRSNNYICHLLTVKKDLLMEAGLYKEEFDGAQDYDYILRCAEKTDSIYHIPKILYHWRCHENSTSENPDSKLYAFKAGKKALEDHIKRKKIDAKVEEGPYHGTYHIIYGYSKTMPITIIVVGDRIYDKACVDSIECSSKYVNKNYLFIEKKEQIKEQRERSIHPAPSSDQVKLPKKFDYSMTAATTPAPTV